MIADVLTKGLHAEQFIKLKKMMGLKELKQYDSKWEGVLRTDSYNHIVAKGVVYLVHS